jgi:hypothetical protein
MTLAYTSLAQCNMSASGRAAPCIVNPVLQGAQDSAAGATSQAASPRQLI